MTDLRDLGGLIGLSLRDPGAAMRAILDMRLTNGTLWMALGLTTVLGTLLATLVNGAVIELPLGTENVVLGPAGFTAVTGGLLVLGVFAVHLTGRALGGEGTLDGAIAVVAWFEVLALIFRTAQIALILTLPFLALPLSIGALVILIYMLLHFTKELHGFASLGRAAGTLVLGVFGMSFGLALILTVIGVGTGMGDMGEIR